jgi:hypothetical protein
LRLRLKGTNLSKEEFEELRRSLLAELHGLKEKGTLFFKKNQEQPTDPALIELAEAAKYVAWDVFLYPNEKGMTFDKSKVQNNAIREHTRSFAKAVQRRVGGEWLACWRNAGKISLGGVPECRRNQLVSVFA